MSFFCFIMIFAGFGGVFLQERLLPTFDGSCNMNPFLSNSILKIRKIFELIKALLCWISKQWSQSMLIQIIKFPVYHILLLQNESMKLSSKALSINLKPDVSDAYIVTVNFRYISFQGWSKILCLFILKFIKILPQFISQSWVPLRV